MNLLHSYSHTPDHLVKIFDDGTKVRTFLPGSKRLSLPEQMDLKITDWCDAACQWCHEQSTPKGKHGDLQATLEVLKPLPAGVEIAIGGGDALSHPGFADFVRELRNRGLVPSVTVNGRHFTRHRDLLEKLINERCLFGVGISYHQELPQWDYEHMVVHLIAGVHAPSILDCAARQKILILGYKQHGRGKKMFQVMPEKISQTISDWYREIAWVVRSHAVSFDNLAIEQLNPSRLFLDHAQYASRFMGEEGQFGMYLDAVKQTYALSSYSDSQFKWTQFPAMFESL